MIVQAMYDDMHASLFAIVAFFNRPYQDSRLLKRAGVSLDTALFPLLMRIAHQGSLGLVELAEQVGRDHSTVSRQADKLVRLGLVSSAAGVKDRRVRRLTLTNKGTQVAKKIIVTRRVMMKEALKGWSKQERKTLQENLRRLAETLGDRSPTV